LIPFAVTFIGPPAAEANGLFAILCCPGTLSSHPPNKTSGNRKIASSSALTFNPAFMSNRLFISVAREGCEILKAAVDYLQGGG
jgi:hypothetical protein